MITEKAKGANPMVLLDKKDKEESIVVFQTCGKGSALTS